MTASTPSTPPQDEKKASRTSLQLGTSAAHDSHGEEPRKLDTQDQNARLANPLKSFTRAECAERARQWADEAGLSEERELFARAALVAQNPTLFEEAPELTEADKEALRFERDHPYRQPRALWLLALTVSLSAAVQGMDQSVINGALLFFPEQFGIEGRYGGWVTGIVAAAPYFSCALLASFLTAPLNKYFGRRGTIAITCCIASVTCIWSAVTDSWWHLMIARIALGAGIAPKSATTPIYAAETAPAKIRGLLCMQWQTWTAFGIMLGYVASLAFYFVPDQAGIVGLRWRLMLGSAAIPPIFVLALIFLSPESPRWLMSKGRKSEAYYAMRKLRNTPLEAARDLYYASELLQAEREILHGQKTRNAVIELFATSRNRLAVQSSSFVMLMQQMCGINVVAYFSSQIFVEAGTSEAGALAASLGFGTLNWLAAVPAFWAIDKMGRRQLLLIGYPLMGCALLVTALSFLASSDTGRIAGVALGIYIHCLFYSPTAGPVPFTYSAECYPLSVRESGMSLAVAVCWFFNGVLSLTFPAMRNDLTNTGAFGFYAGCNFAGFVFAYLLLPETKGLTLEELDAVFSVSNTAHAAYQTRLIPFHAARLVGRRGMDKGEPLYAHEKLSLEERMAKGTLVPQAAGH